MTLRDKAKGLNSEGGIKFMDNREKGNLPLNSEVTIVDYGFMKKPNKPEFCSLALREFPEHFFFAGSVVAEKLRGFNSEDKAEIRVEGLPVLFAVVDNKEKTQKYTTCEFYPSNPSSIGHEVNLDDDIPF